MTNFEKLLENCDNFRNPKSYFKGVSLNRDLIPDNLICFVHDYNLLNQSSSHYCFHHRFLVIFPLKGEGVIGVERDFFQLREGKALLIFPYQMHFFPAIEEGWEWLIMSFEANEKWLEPLKNRICKVEHDFMEKGAEAALLYRSLIDDEASDNLNLVEIFRDILHYMLSAGFCDEFQELSPKWQRAYEILRKVDKFVDDNIKDDVSAMAIAEHFNLAKNYLAALFKSNFGLTLGQYVTNLKVQKATDLLLNTDLQMVEIAEESGFDNPVSFNRAFKRLMLLPPGKYRAENRNKARN